MKIQCDVCNEESATFFCSADEAALCDRCDRRVHSANKVARGHRRFHLFSPSPSASPPPLCDICQEKRGFLFCQQDRAVMCRDCDVSIHNANVHTMKHCRFLLTGIRVSSDSATCSEGEGVPESASDESEINQEKEEVLCSTTASCEENKDRLGINRNVEENSSSISEYLINMLPGWHVEDFLFDDAAATNSTATTSCSHQGDELFPFVENIGGGGNNDDLNVVAVDGLPNWVPTSGYFDEGIVNREVINENRKEVKSSRQKRRSEEVFNVPEFHYEWRNTKRSRTSLC